MPFFYKMGVFGVFQWKIVFTIDDYRATAFVPQKHYRTKTVKSA